MKVVFFGFVIVQRCNDFEGICSADIQVGYVELKARISFLMKVLFEIVFYLLDVCSFD